MSVPEKVLMRKIKKREKTKLTVLKRLEEQKGKIVRTNFEVRFREQNICKFADSLALNAYNFNYYSIELSSTC